MSIATRCLVGRLASSLMIASATVLISNAASAATIVNDTFDTGLDGWEANTSQTTVEHNASLGNPAGSLQTSNTDGSFKTIGAVNKDADHSGVFADGFWTISFDVNYLRGDTGTAALRFRYQDATFNGWYFVVDSALTSGTGWESYSVTFNTLWDDATAIAQGWIQENNSVAFALLFDDVYTSEVRLSTSLSSVALIDNYSASPVPVPAALPLLASGLGALGFAGWRRSKKNKPAA